jgi:hypothetical protein
MAIAMNMTLPGQRDCEESVEVLRMGQGRRIVRADQLLGKNVGVNVARP